MAIVHENILKILDIHYSLFSKEFIGFIAHSQPVYKDRVLDEDIYSPQDLQEGIADAFKINNQLIEIIKLMQQHECSYFRIIYT